MFGPSFGHAAEMVTLAAVLDPPSARPALDQLLGPARDIGRSDAPGVDHLWDQNLGALAVLTLAETAGWDAPGDLTARPLDRLLRTPSSAPDVIRRTIWASLAQGRADGLAEYLREDPTRTPDPGAKFTGAVQPVQAHLARCIVAGDAPAAEPAWRAYFEGFAISLSVAETTWCELLWAARAVRVVLGGAAPDGVLAWLRAEIAAAG